MAARTSGSKLVGAAIAATVAVVGIGTMSPWVLDRDRLRGLHEEEKNAPTSAMLAEEVRKLQKVSVEEVM
jgi:hypothetical protein